MNRSDLNEMLGVYKTNLRYEEKAKNSIDSYCRYARMFVNFISHDNDITKDDVLDFKDYLIDVLQFSSSSINHIIVCVNKFLYFCKLEHLKVKKIKTTENSMIDEIMSQTDYKRLLRNAKVLGMNDMYLIMKIFAMTGIRNEELKFFTYENVKKGVYISVRNKGKTREIILRQDLRREILRYCKENNIESGYIFHSPKDKNKMLHRSTIFRRLKKIAGKARVKKDLIYAHAFRHLFAITYLEQGGNALNLAQILGHSSLETTKIYAKNTREQLRKQLENVKFTGGKNG